LYVILRISRKKNARKMMTIDRKDV
jgi:hypothetical protein